MQRRFFLENGHPIAHVYGVCKWQKDAESLSRLSRRTSYATLRRFHVLSYALRVCDFFTSRGRRLECFRPHPENQVVPAHRSDLYLGNNRIKAKRINLFSLYNTKTK